MVIAQDDTASHWQSWQPAEHSKAGFYLQVWSHLIHPLEQVDGHGHRHRRELEEMGHIQPGAGFVQGVGNVLHYQWGLWTLRASEPTHTSICKEMWATNSENLNFSDRLIINASNSGMLPFLPGLTDLSPLNYAPSVTVMFSDVDRWMELRLSLCLVC